jgi:hypothetical protein
VKKSEENLQCAASLKQLSSSELAGEVTCLECLTNTQLKKTVWNYKLRGCHERLRKRWQIGPCPCG